jgi:hypothetical protein
MFTGSKSTAPGARVVFFAWGEIYSLFPCDLH